MATNEPYVLRWGILATGNIAETFAKDLLTDPKLRETSDVCHEIVAVASSTSRESAAKFLHRIDGSDSATCYGSYADLVKDPKVGIVYVATPHSHHFQNAMLALEAGKHVLCEKPLALTAAQATKLVKTARDKRLFLMEGVWTRFFPLSYRLREMISSGKIGTPLRTTADFSFNHHEADGGLSLDANDRLLRKDLAGGALLDLGVYCINWIFHTLYNPKSVEEKETPVITAAMNKYKTGVDEMTTVICQFPKNRAMGIGLTSLRVDSHPNGQFDSGPVICIKGSDGEIQVFGNGARPVQLRLLRNGEETKVLDGVCPKDPNRGDWGHGMYWEADECARCIRDEKMESNIMPLDESVLIIQSMETALIQGGISYPSEIISDTYEGIHS